jgi:hypothetical protein
MYNYADKKSGSAIKLSGEEFCANSLHTSSIPRMAFTLLWFLVFLLKKKI